MIKLRKSRRALVLSFSEISGRQEACKTIVSLSKEYEHLQVIAFGEVSGEFAECQNVEYIQLDALPHSDKAGCDDLWVGSGLDEVARQLSTIDRGILRELFNNCFFRFAAIMAVSGGHGVIYADGEEAVLLARCANLLSGGRTMVRQFSQDNRYAPVDLMETSTCLFRSKSFKLMKRETVVVVSLSPVARDCRVLRQIHFLSERFGRVVVIGLGNRPDFSDSKPNILWISLGENACCHWGKSRLGGGFFSRCLNLGRKALLAHYYSDRRCLQASLIVRQFRMRLLICNDTDTLPLGMLAAAKSRRFTKVVFDLHEWPTEQYMGEDGDPERVRFIRRIFRYCARVPGFTTTVADSFLDIFPKEYGLKKICLVRNAPGKINLPQQCAPNGKIRMIHHGGCSAGREPERMIEAMTYLEDRFVLHLMLIPGQDTEYYKSLKKLAAEKAPGKVVFEEPVPANMIIETLAGNYDLGLYLLPPDTPNHLHALPNKFFDFIVAGLAVAVGPSLNMAKYAREHGIGWVADDFEPATMARMLNSLTIEDIEQARLCSMQLREQINAEKEVGRFAEMCRTLADTGKVVA